MDLAFTSDVHFVHFVLFLFNEYDFFSEAIAKNETFNYVVCPKGCISLIISPFCEVIGTDLKHFPTARIRAIPDTSSHIRAWLYVMTRSHCVIASTIAILQYMLLW